jgi:hypothetical protein
MNGSSTAYVLAAGQDYGITGMTAFTTGVRAMNDEAVLGASVPERLNAGELRTMARDVVTNLALITNKEHVITSAFMLMTAFMDWSKVDLSAVGAIYGEWRNAVRGRSCNGYPIFTAWRLIHAEDTQPLIDEIDRLSALLGFGEGSEN